MESGNRIVSRREVLAAFGCLAAAGPAAMSAVAQKSKSVKGKGIALQLYTLREQAQADLAGTLKKAREIGWEYVQWSGMPNLNAVQIREALDKAGLKAMAVHAGMEDFEKDFEGSAKFWKTVGALDVAPGSMMKECQDSLEAWLRGAKRLDAIGAKLRAVGMRLSYHNHSFEFEKFTGDPRNKLDILMESTKPENLKAELDTAWVFNGGADPAAYIRKYKGRCPVIHVKDIAAAVVGKGKVQFKPLGQGALPWKDIFAAGRESGVDWYIYEQDGGDGSPFDYAKASFEFLAKNVL
jgi:sugar phosphate isomerase/epimerase